MLISIAMSGSLILVAALGLSSWGRLWWKRDVLRVSVVVLCGIVPLTWGASLGDWPRLKLVVPEDISKLLSPDGKAFESPEPKVLPSTSSSLPGSLESPHDSLGVPLESETSFTLAWETGFTLVWILGALGVALWSWRREVQVAASLRQSCRPDESLSERVGEIAHGLGIHPPSVFRSERISTPLVMRCSGENCLVLPWHLERVSQEALGSCLRHELAHLAQGDLCFRHWPRIALWIWWWNPLAAMVVRRLNTTSEQIADRLAVVPSSAPFEYAKALVRFAEFPQSAALPGPGLTTRCGLEQRVASLVDGSSFQIAKRCRWIPVWGIAWILLVLSNGCQLSSPGDLDAEDSRLLLVGDSPHWDYRYLKQAVFSLDDVKVQTQLHSVGKDFVQESSPGMNSLKTIPDGKILSETYSTIVLCGIDDEKWVYELSPDLVDFVVGGGRLILLPSPKTGYGAYQQSVLEEILPQSSADYTHSQVEGGEHIERQTSAHEEAPQWQLRAGTSTRPATVERAIGKGGVTQFLVADLWKLRGADGGVAYRDLWHQVLRGR